MRQPVAQCLLLGGAAGRREGDNSRALPETALSSCSMRGAPSNVLQRFQTSRGRHHPPRDHPIDAVGPPLTADTSPIVIWTGDGKRVRLSYRGGPRPTICAATSWANFGHPGKRTIRWHVLFVHAISALF